MLSLFFTVLRMPMAIIASARDVVGADANEGWSDDGKLSPSTRVAIGVVLGVIPPEHLLWLRLTDYPFVLSMSSPLLPRAFPRSLVSRCHRRLHTDLEMPTDEGCPRYRICGHHPLALAQGAAAHLRPHSAWSRGPSEAPVFRHADDTV